MNVFQTRMRTLGMSIHAVARRARLPIETVTKIVDPPATEMFDPTTHSKIEMSLGMQHGKKLVSNRTYFKHAARERARFLVAMTQGNMGLEAQGLSLADKDALYRKTVRRLLADKRKLW